MLLNGSPFLFVIDLAALASRREYLKLDKWLKDKLKEHQVTQKLSDKLSFLICKMITYFLFSLWEIVLELVIDC